MVEDRVWPVSSKKGDLSLPATPNQDHHSIYEAEKPKRPILAIDLWEHAYYLTLQHRRAADVEAFWRLINGGI